MGSSRDECSSQMKFNSNEEVLCYCKQVSPISTSWTKENPGRRFYGCSRYRVGVSFSIGMKTSFPKELGTSFLLYEKKKIRLGNENERLRKQLWNAGIKVDDGDNVGGSISTGVVGSNVVDDEATRKHDGESEEIEKIRVEVDLLKEENRRLKLKACSNKKSKEIYRLCFLVSCVLNGFILLFLKSNSNGNGFLSLP
ncbi:Zinc finger, GRF-type [Corchorus olitorius]|uniref:Zinc finger, GRF-type n=1 Tax=Corchorus olitorius TaxID=93759 RepID=A0A1R3J2Y1_9ROSI|nr:Zinc finger, GRF-type [Corchorus olitorius]